MKSQHSDVLSPERTAVEMKSAVVTAPGRIELMDMKKPQPEANEVLIRLEGCGLCASNIAPWEGRDWFTYPMRSGSPGHEGWGTIEEVGADVDNLQVGDRVTGLSYRAFAEYDVAKARHLVKLPRSLDDKPFPGEPLGCAINIFERCRIEPGMAVAVIGVGFLGTLLIQLLKDAGARVIALSCRRSSLQRARKMGADDVFPVDDHQEVTKQVKNFTGGRFCDCVIEAVGKPDPLDLAGKLTAVRGRLVIAGYHQDGLRQIDMQLWNWRGIDVINAHERDPEKYTEGMEKAIKAIEQGVMDPFPLFTHTFTKEDIQLAFETHKMKPEGFVKALVTFDQ